MITLGRMKELHGFRMHPVFHDRFFRWVEAQGGKIGIGGGWRATGTQPDRYGFAPEGKSFHQSQTFASGIVAYCAVDLVHVNPGGVHRAPRWDEVPAQGSAEAARWGVHCNVSSEAWHMQPVEIDGWQSWVDNGRKDPVSLVKDVPMQTVRKRLYDSRNGQAAPTSATIAVGPYSQAVVTIVTVRPDRGGWAAVWGGGNLPANYSCHNFNPGLTESTNVLTDVVDGKIKVFLSSPTHFLVDVQGVL